MVPDADVVILPGDHEAPVPFEITNMAMNNEANAWVIFPPRPALQNVNANPP